jgi:hypothetical protein
VASGVLPFVAREDALHLGGRYQHGAADLAARAEAVGPLAQGALGDRYPPLGEQGNPIGGRAGFVKRGAAGGHWHGPSY